MILFRNFIFNTAKAKLVFFGMNRYTLITPDQFHSVIAPCCCLLIVAG